MIYCVYGEEPNFPASDQQPDAIRFIVGEYIVDASTEPTLEEIETFIYPSAEIGESGGVNE